MDERALERILRGLNALGKAFFAARIHGAHVRSRTLTVSSLCALGLTRSDCADLLDRGMAAEWLLEMLAQGPIDATRQFEECRACHISERTMRRAAADLGLHPIKDGQSGPWLWGYGTGPAPPGSDASPVPNVAACAPIGNLPTAAVLEVELRRDAAPTVAALEPVGNLPESAETELSLGGYDNAESVQCSRWAGADRPSSEPLSDVRGDEVQRMRQTVARIAS